MTANILIIEDDKTVNELVSANLQRDGYRTSSIFDGAKGVQEALDQHYDLVLLDMMLPSMDGIQVLGHIREHKQTPVLMLTAKGGEEDRIRGFKSGADDYLSKPFSMAELSLRIEAILRRARMTQESHSDQHQLINEVIRIDPNGECVHANGRSVSLTPLQLRLLKTLVQEAGKTLSKPFLYQSVLSREFSRYDRTLDMHISHIRKKLAAIELSPNCIRTIHRKGYQFNLYEE